LFSISSHKSTLGFTIEKLGTTSEQNDRKAIKTWIEDQQLTVKVDLGTTSVSSTMKIVKGEAPVSSGCT